MQIYPVNTLRSRQNGRHFAEDIFMCIFLNEHVWISIRISLKFVPSGPIDNIPALVQIMAWRRPGDKPLSEPMIASLPTHICVTRPQWVKTVQNILQLTQNKNQRPCFQILLHITCRMLSSAIWQPPFYWEWKSLGCCTPFANQWKTFVKTGKVSPKYLNSLILLGWSLEIMLFTSCERPPLI